MAINSFYQQASFILSCPSIKDAPQDKGCEVVFAGRSNAGKSSAINAITNQKKLAKVSKTPGRTQHLVYFGLKDDKRLVDLPGYGFAKVPTRVKQKWHQSMAEYFANRKSLCGAVLIMDIRHPLKPFDRQMLSWCDLQSVPVHILLTKADKISTGAAKLVALNTKKQLQSYPKVSVQTFSALKKQNLDIVWQALDKLLQLNQ